MSDLRSLVIKSGTTQNISNADTLIVGTKVDAASGQTLSVGDVNATGITIGSALITTNFPGPVTLTGDVTTVGGTTFTTDATFEGNVTFGAGAADTVTFAALTTITSDIAMGGGSPTYKVTNLANGTNPNDAVNFSQLSAIVSGVSAVTATSPVLSSGGATPDISISTAGAFAGDVLTYNGAAWAAAAPAVTATAQGGANAVQYANSATPANFDGENTKLAFNESTSQLSVGTGTANETLTVNGRVSIAEGTVPSNTASFGKLWASSADQTLHFYDNSIDYLVTPNTVSTLTYAASVALDFAPSLPPLKSVTLTGDITFTTSNLLASRNISVRVIGDTVSRNLVFPAGWTWLGGATPTVLEANKTAILSLAAFSGANTGIIASWSYDGSVVVTSVTASTPLLSSGGTTPNLSITAGTASGELLTWNGSAWVAAAPATSGTVTGTGVATRLAFWNGTSVLSSNANLYWDDANSRLGVGTNTPTTAVDVATGQVAIPDGTAAAPALAFRDDLNTGLYSPTNDIVGVAVNGAEVARFQQSGAGNTPVMLLGTSTVYGAITVDSSDASGAAGVVMLGHAAAGTVIQESYRGGQFAGVRSRGTKAAPTAVASGDGLVNMLGAGWTATGGINYGGVVMVKAEEAYTATASGGRIEFHTTTLGTDGFTTLGSATTERIRIASSGNVGIGTTNTSAHLFNVGSGASANFAIASGGFIHTYGGATPTDGQVLIGHTGNGRFQSATLTAGTGISVTNGAGSVTIASTGTTASAFVDVPGYVAQQALNAGDLVRFVDDAGTPKVQKADATNTDARLNPVGFAVAAALVGGAVTVRVAGVADVPAARFDVAPAAADVGKRVFVSTTSGQITLTAPSASGDVLQRAGVLVDGGANPKVLVQIGDPTLL